MQYICTELEARANIYGHRDCAVWQEIPAETFVSILDALAITKESAAGLTLAICTLLVIAYIGGLIGRAMLQV